MKRVSYRAVRRAALSAAFFGAAAGVVGGAYLERWHPEKLFDAFAWLFFPLCQDSCRDPDGDGHSIQRGVR